MSYLDQGYTLISCIGGNAYNVLGLVQHPQPFDFIDPAHPNVALVENAQLVPSDTVKAVLKGKVTNQAKSVRAINTLAPVTHLESPPPVHSDDLNVESIGKVFRDQGIDAAGITPSSTRLKLWRFHAEVFASLPAEDGIPMFQNPQSIKNDLGYLKAELGHKDGTHANGDYGKCVMDALLSSLIANRSVAV